MAFAAPGAQNLGVDALAVIPHPNVELSSIVENLHFDSAGSGMPEGIAHRLASNSVYFVPDERREVPGFSLEMHAKLGNLLASIGNEAFSEAANGARKVLGNNFRRAQRLHSIPALANHLSGLLQKAFQHLFCFSGTIADHIYQRRKLH